MKEIIKKIKQKKELSDIPDELVSDTLNNYLKKYKIQIPKKKRQQRILIKEIRAELRRYAGQYHIKSKTRLELLKDKKIKNLLETHASTKERLPYYSALIKLISGLAPLSIIDLGCGLNPIAIMEEINNIKIKYYAVDIKESELKLIDLYFKKHKIKGKTILADIRKLKLSELPKTDLCLILKTLDLVDTKNHQTSIKILDEIKSRNLIVSFATRTLSGRSMKYSRRFWFENILKRKEYKYKILKIPNEIFYLIEN